MADTLKRLAGPSALTASAATIYTVPAVTTTALRHIQVANTTATAISFTLSIGVDAAGTRLFAAVAIAANSVLAWAGLQVLSAAEVIQAYGSATGLTITISGVETA